MKNQQFYVKTARLAVPIMMQNMITIGVNMADNIMVGSLGENALYALALANQFIIFTSSAVWDLDRVHRL